jgi:predicted enzyme related to lactoylglutathione lyase
MTTDPERAIAYYGKAIGWKTQSFEHDPSYRMWTMGGAPMGGVMQLPDAARREGAPPHWMSYVGTPDADATVRQAAALRGRTLVPPTNIPGAGRFAVLADPQGAAFAVYQPPAGEPPRPEPGVGDFSWHELVTTDYKAAWEFYRALFGWVPTQSMDMGPLGVYWMFGVPGGESMGGMFNKPPEVPAPAWLPYVRVRSAADAVAAATRAGGKVMTGPMEVPGGDMIAQMMDPQGAVYAVHALKVDAAAARPAAKAGAKRKARRPARKKAAAKRAKAKPKKARRRARKPARKRAVRRVRRKRR